MKIELKNVRVLKSMSQETACFEAVVYIDGKKAGTVGNAGHGGSDDFYPWALKTRLDEYAKTLPPIPPSHFGPDCTTGLPMDAELLIGNLLEDYMATKELKSALAKRVLWSKADQTIWQSKPLKAGQLLQLKQGGEPLIRKTFRLADTDAVLNVLPFDEALALYRTSQP